jgi:PAT family beta-lactamase induction signal transducer AmpG
MYGHNLKAIIVNPRILAVLCLGFSSGLPLMLTLSTLQAWFTEAGVSIITIGALSLVGLPYVWKFLWAPLMDRFVPPKGGRRRGWIMITQMGLCISLLWIATLNPEHTPKLIGLVALIIAFFSASQDIAVDAYRTDILLPEERGVGSACYIFAYRIAMLVSGGLALVVADRLGWRATYQLMAGLIALSMIATYFAPRVKGEVAAAQDILVTIKESFGDLLKRESIVVLLLFVVFYKLGDALALSLITNFLLKGLGFSLTEIGLVFKTISLVATVLGAFIGGTLLIGWGLYRSLLIFGFAQAVSTLTFMLLAVVGKNYSLMVASLFIENVCSGMGTAAFMAFLMSLCHQRYTATQYASLSALASIGRVCLGPVAGYLVLNLGWVSFFAWSFALSIPGLFLLIFLRNKVSFNAEMAIC